MLGKIFYNKITIFFIMRFPTWKPLLSKKWALLIVVFALLFTGGYFYYIKFSVFFDDQTLILKIREDSRVNYTYIKLGGISPQTDYMNPTKYPPYIHLPGYWVRSFYAWEYPEGSVDLRDNMLIIGLIDENYNIAIIERRSAANPRM
jgi:hypothetical protein